MRAVALACCLLAVLWFLCRLDGYMEKNGFGEAGVVHAFDLKDDKTDNGRNHLEVSQMYLCSLALV